MTEILPVSLNLSNKGLQGFFIELCNSFLSYLTQKLRAIKLESVKKGCDLLNKMDVFLTLRTLTARNF